MGHLQRQKEDAGETSVEVHFREIRPMTYDVIAWSYYLRMRAPVTLFRTRGQVQSNLHINMAYRFCKGKATPAKQDNRSERSKTQMRSSEASRSTQMTDGDISRFR